MSSITYTVRKTPHIQEWAARFHVDGRFQPEWTVFETDRAAAEASAQAVVRDWPLYLARMEAQAGACVDADDPKGNPHGD